MKYDVVILAGRGVNMTPEILAFERQYPDRVCVIAQNHLPTPTSRNIRLGDEAPDVSDAEEGETENIAPDIFEEKIEALQGKVSSDTEFHLCTVEDPENEEYIGFFDHETNDYFFAIELIQRIGSILPDQDKINPVIHIHSKNASNIVGELDSTIKDRLHRNEEAHIDAGGVIISHEYSDDQSEIDMQSDIKKMAGHKLNSPKESIENKLKHFCSSEFALQVSSGMILSLVKSEEVVECECVAFPYVADLDPELEDLLRKIDRERPISFAARESARRSHSPDTERSTRGRG